MNKGDDMLDYMPATTSSVKLRDRWPRPAQSEKSKLNAKKNAHTRTDLARRLRVKVRWIYIMQVCYISVGRLLILA